MMLDPTTNAPRERHTLFKTIALAVDGLQPISERKLNALRAIELASIDAFEKGTATEEDFWNIQAMCCLCKEFKWGYVGMAAGEACRLLNSDSLSIFRRYGKNRLWSATKEEVQSMRDVYEYLDFQRKLADSMTLDINLKTAMGHAEARKKDIKQWEKTQEL